MTDLEKAIVMAYTGCTMLVGDKLNIFYQYVQEKLGRCVMTHELAYREVQDAIQEAAKEDFIALAKSDNGWISVDNALPIESGYYAAFCQWRVRDVKRHRNFIDSNVEIKWYDSYGFDDETVTHWMPIPQPPEPPKEANADE